MPQKKQTQPNSSDEGMGFFGSISESSRNDDDNIDISQPPVMTTADDKRKRLAKRLIDMTDKMEDLSNQIYHMQQRIEVLERKLQVSRYDN